MDDRFKTESVIGMGQNMQGAHDCMDAGGRAPKVGAIRRRMEQLPRTLSRSDGGPEEARGEAPTSFFGWSV